jgi:hypothetical protein
MKRRHANLKCKSVRVSVRGPGMVRLDRDLRLGAARVATTYLSGARGNKCPQCGSVAIRVLDD